MNKKISVIIPVYKVEQYLNRCVESVVNQTYKNLEIILVDDGSPDNCPKMCDAWAKKDDRIKVIHKINGGLSDARNAGLDIATGDYVTFLDSDDTIMPDFSDACMSIAKTTDILKSDFVGNKTKMIYLYVANGKRYKINYQISACGKVYRVEFLKNNSIKFKKGLYHEDVDFSLRVLLAKPNIQESNVNFYYYNTETQGSITREINNEKYKKRIVDTMQIIHDIDNEFGLNKNQLKYCSIFLYNALKLAINITDENLFYETVAEIEKNKKLFRMPNSIKNKMIMLGWNVFGLKHFLTMIKRLRRK